MNESEKRKGELSSGGWLTYNINGNWAGFLLTIVYLFV